MAVGGGGERDREAARVQCEVWDLRTIVPYDREAILASAKRTGKVLIAQNDRTFHGFGRQIQGDLVESVPGCTVRLIGQLDTPAVGQARALEDAITLQVEDIAKAIDQLADSKPAAWLENEAHWMQYWRRAVCCSSAGRLMKNREAPGAGGGRGCARGRPLRLLVGAAFPRAGARMKSYPFRGRLALAVSVLSLGVVGSGWRV